MKIYQKKIRGCDDSFFYEGVIAKKGENILVATGIIRVYSNIDDRYTENRDDLWTEYPNDKALLEGQNKAEKKGIIDFWGNNNWFEILDDSSDIGEVYYSYSGAIKELNKL